MTQNFVFNSLLDDDGRSGEEIIRELKSEPVLYNRYLSMNNVWKMRFMDFCQGKKTLPLTYDPFFKSVFHPDIHPGRLSRFLSSLLGVSVKVIRILPMEETVLDGGALMIMDILVELEDGALANVEVQKIPYAFPGERISCYSSDLVLRQYSRVRGEKGNRFTYRDMKKVYTIVIYEESAGVFHDVPDQYIHMGKTVFDSGLKMELLQEYCLVALDVFREFPYPKVRNEQTAWLSLMSTEDIRDAEALIREYPWLEEIYAEMAGLMHNPKEVLNMFSDALKILDHNTVQYMIEEQKKEIENQKKELEEYKKLTREMEEETRKARKEKEAAERERIEAEQEREAAKKRKEAAEREKLAAEKRKEAAEREKLAAEKQKEIAEREKLAVEKQKEAAEREKLAAEKQKEAAEIEKLQAEKQLEEKEALIAELMKRLEEKN